MMEHFAETHLNELQTSETSGLFAWAGLGWAGLGWAGLGWITQIRVG